MTNPYYSYTDGVPISGSRGIASVIQAEYALIASGFDVFTNGAPTASTPVGNIATSQIANTSWVSTWYAPIASPTFTGVPAAPTASPGTSSTQIATTAFVQTAAFTAALPAQTGGAGKFIYTDGSTASWVSLGGPVTVVSATTQTAVAGNHYILTNVAATTVTLPASPASGDTVWVTVTNDLTTNVIARNGQTIMGVAEDMTIDNQNSTVELRFVNSSWRLV